MLLRISQFTVHYLPNVLVLRPRRLSGLGVMLIADHRIVSKLIMSGSLPSLPPMLSWRTKR